jgi:hypothetical protein
VAIVPVFGRTRARNALVRHVGRARTNERFRDEAWLTVSLLKQSLGDAEEALVARMSHELMAVGPVKIISTMTDGNWSELPSMPGGVSLD